MIDPIEVEFVVVDEEFQVVLIQSLTKLEYLIHA